MEKPAAPAQYTINWVLTEDQAQKVINIFEWAVRNGGLPIGKETQPLANDLMETAMKAKEAREAAANSNPKKKPKN